MTQQADTQVVIVRNCAGRSAYLMYIIILLLLLARLLASCNQYMERIARHS